MKTASKTDTSAMAAALSGKKIRRITIEPADNGFTVDTDHDSGDGPYLPSKKSVYANLDGVKQHLDQHVPTPKKKVIDTGAKRTRKMRIVDTSKKRKK